MKNFLLLLNLLFLLFVIPAQADNTGQINGTVTDSATGETLIGASVFVMMNGNLVGATADVEGYYVIKPLQPGIYDVKVRYIGYAEMTITGVRVSQNSIAVINPKLSKAINTITVCTITANNLISTDPILGIITADEVAKGAVRGVDNLVTTFTGVFQSDTDGELYFRGSRPEATEYYIDNVKVVGNHNIPNGAVAEVAVYSGGIPARYGDVTGGVVVITTKSYNMYQRFE